MVEPGPTRSQALGLLITNAVLESRMGWQVYVDRVVADYHAHTAVHDRTIDLRVASCADDVEPTSRANTQTIRRYLSGERRMLVDIEESLVRALPEPYSEQVLVAMLDRKGLLLARRPQGASQGIASACELMHSTADLLQAMAPAMVDGRIGADDQPYLGAIKRNVGTLMGALITIDAQVAVAMGQGAAAAEAGA